MAAEETKGKMEGKPTELSNEELETVAAGADTVVYRVYCQDCGWEIMEFNKDDAYAQARDHRRLPDHVRVGVSVVPPGQA